MMSILQHMADKFGITIIVVNHMRKQGADDIHDRQIGTTGITGTADAFVTIDRIRGQIDAVWHVSGRETEEQELAIRFNKETCRWEMLGDNKQVVIAKSKADIIRVIQEEGRPMTAAELSAILNKDGGTLRSMSRMAKEGLLIKTEEGYKVPE